MRPYQMKNFFAPVPAFLLAGSLAFFGCSPSGTEASAEAPVAVTAVTEIEPEITSVAIPESSLELSLAYVPGGMFLMGSPETGQHDVHVDPFWMSQHEITWNLYNQFLEADIQELRREVYKTFYNVDIETADAVSAPTWTEEMLEMLRASDVPSDVISTPSPSWGDLSGGMGTDGFPTVNITHYAAMMFTKWLTIKTGEFYRLPTEAEWEFACRAGETGNYLPNLSSDLIDHKAWHRGNSDRSYHRIGSKQANAFGIYDLLGNVAEWTLDQYHPDYFAQLEESPAVNPWFKPDQLYPRAVRGGSWMDNPEEISCLQRRGSDPSWKRNDPQLPKSLWWHTNAFHIGFRVIRPVDQPSGVYGMEEYWIDAIQDYY